MLAHKMCCVLESIFNAECILLSHIGCMWFSLGLWCSLSCMYCSAGLVFLHSVRGFWHFSEMTASDPGWLYLKEDIQNSLCPETVIVAHHMKRYKRRKGPLRHQTSPRTPISLLFITLCCTSVSLLFLFITVSPRATFLLRLTCTRRERSFGSRHLSKGQAHAWKDNDSGSRFPLCSWRIAFSVADLCLYLLFCAYLGVYSCSTGRGHGLNH